ncbi:MAG: hemolysin family protein [Pseudomonadota bacterium]|nr:hemolysin family protein [Pseudomonadota bacterium]|tara:strand:- start:1193 stop:2047 length:855 start_codon:yes stop_codon:yes gene_type:complete
MKNYYDKILKFIQLNHEKAKDILTKKEKISLKDIIKDHIDNEREFSIEEREMLTNIIGFGKSRVEDSMVPRADIISADINTPAEEIIKLFSECNHSRIAIYRENLDDPVGMLHIKDFVGALSEKNIEEITIEPLVKDLLFVPPSMKSRELLLKMQVSRVHMALVVDEYGGTDGLLTIENLIEEIVGEIEDEHSDAEVHKINIYENFIDIPARATIQEVEEILGFELLNDDIDEEIDTIGGLVFLLAGRIPQRGELITHPKDFEIEIREVDQRKIINVRFRLKVK